MTAFEPAMRLDLVSDLDRSMGHEKYHRDAANMLIELLQQWASAKTIAQLSAGRTALQSTICDQRKIQQLLGSLRDLRIARS